MPQRAFLESWGVQDMLLERDTPSHPLLDISSLDEGSDVVAFLACVDFGELSAPFVASRCL